MWLAARWVLELDCDQLTADPERDRVVDGIASLPHNIFWMPTVAWLAEVVAATGSEAQAGALYELLLPFDALLDRAGVRRLLRLGHPAARPAGGPARPPDQAGAHLRAASTGTPRRRARARGANPGRSGLGDRTGSRDGTTAEAEALLFRARQLAHGCGAQRLSDRLARIGSAASQSRWSAAGSRLSCRRAAAAACHGGRPGRSGRAPTPPARTPRGRDCGRSPAADRSAPRSPAASPAARPLIAIGVTPHDVEGRAAGLIREICKKSLYQRDGGSLYRACNRPSLRRRICRGTLRQGGSAVRRVEA